jgi:hypothetical protein
MTFSVITDGVNEEDTLQPAPITKSTRKYYTVGTAAFDTTNTNDDYDDAYREDYSARFCGLGFDFPFDFPLDFQGTCPTGSTYNIDAGVNGFNPDGFQRIEDAYATDARGDYLKVKMVNTQGRTRVHSVKGEAFTTNRTATISA